MRRIGMLAAGVLVAALSACGPGAPGAGGGDSAAAKKLNAYVSAYNGVTQSSLGLADQYKRYVELDIPRESPKENIVIQPDWVGDKLEALKAARALPGGPPELDAAGDRAIATLSTVITRFEGLKTYYESRKYADDGLARGKAEDAPMKAEFKASLDAADALAAKLPDLQDAREVKTLDRMKAKDDMIGYDAVLAMQKARALVRLFKTPEDVKDPAAYTRGDALVAELEPLLADSRVQLGKAPKGDGHDRNTYVGDAMDDLNKLVGDYRALKANRDANHVDYMLTNFNFAIQSMNSAASP